MFFFFPITIGADAAHGLGGHVIADGGLKNPGDFAKAFGAGGDFCMAGGVFAGHDESGGELVEEKDGRKYKKFYGERNECKDVSVLLVFSLSLMLCLSRYP